MYEIVVDEIYYRLTSLQDLEEDEPAKLYGVSLLIPCQCIGNVLIIIYSSFPPILPSAPT